MAPIADSKLQQDLNQTMTLGHRLADSLTRRMGSWTFLFIQSIIIVIWITLNLVGYFHRWDPYPFILLNLFFSVEAAYAAPIILMSQNRQEEHDRYQAALNLQTSIIAKKEIEELQLLLSRLEKDKIDEILRILRTQTER
jgi:uncharacterized membrane protein